MGFSSFSSYGSKIAGLGKRGRLALGSLINNRLIAGGNGNNRVAISDDNGINWYLPNNQPFSNSAYSRVAFDGKRVVMGSSNSPCIAYSDDFGLTWVNTTFTGLTAFKIIYIKEKNIWFGVGIGSNGRNIARSTDGINWNLLDDATMNQRVYDIVYNGTVYILCGWSNTYPMATSSDGITWAFNTTYKLDVDGTQPGFFLFYDGRQFVFSGGAIVKSGGTGGNIATSQDGITWYRAGSLPFDIRCIAYNNKDTYVAVGTINGSLNSQAVFHYWSNDLITWYAQSNNTLIGGVFYVVWNGINFIAVGFPLSNSKTNIIYSADGKTWSPSIFDETNNINGIVNGVVSINLLTS